MNLVGNSRQTKSIVPPAQIDRIQRADVANRLLEAAYELRACFNALYGMTALGSCDDESLYGLQAIVGRCMNAIADIALEIDPEIESPLNVQTSAQDS